MVDIDELVGYVIVDIGLASKQNNHLLRKGERCEEDSLLSSKFLIGTFFAKTRFFKNKSDHATKRVTSVAGIKKNLTLCMDSLTEWRKCAYL